MNEAGTSGQDRLLYFAYGSNLSSRYLRDYCPGAQPVMRGLLANFRIEFRRYSTDLEGGISTIMEAPGELVHGMLFTIPKAEIEALDILENVPEGLYSRDGFMVLAEDGQWQRAELYRVARPEGPFAPSARYLDFMLEGAREHGLPDDYVAGLESLRASGS